jgi:hypothetical protein
MAPSSYPSWMDWFSKFQDDQRLERLQYCRELERVLEQCRSRRQGNHPQQQQQQSQEQGQEDGIEGLSPGLRMMKYFGWRGMLKGEKPHPLATHIEASCAREQHSLWACRAVSIGCGKDLGALKKCFDHEGAETILVQPKTGYEESSSHEVPCRELQHALGSCVTDGAQKLFQRRLQRNEKSQAQAEGNVAADESKG